MRCKKLQAVLAVIFCMIISCGGDPVDSSYEIDKTANYLFIFESTWSKETHPLYFPSNPHFSGLIGIVHNENVKLWKENLFASDGVKQVAKTGIKTVLSSEIDPLIINGDAYVRLSGDGIAVSPGKMSMRLTAHSDYHFITLVSKLAPSPDWFVGVSGMSLFENGDWIIEKVVNLYPYDAGTESGETFTADDQPTEPREKIKRINGYPFSVNGTVPTVGTFIFKRL